MYTTNVCTAHYLKAELDVGDTDEKCGDYLNDERDGHETNCRCDSGRNDDGDRGGHDDHCHYYSHKIDNTSE